MTRSRVEQIPSIVPFLSHESVYVGIDVGKQSHVAGFVSTTLLQRHKQFEGCPSLKFSQSREGFRHLIDRVRELVPLEQCFVLMEKTGHYHKALEQYLLELDIAVYLIPVQERRRGMLKTDKRDALGLANHLYNQLEKGIQVADKLQLVRRAVPPSAAAAQLRGFIRHRYELIGEMTQRKNKLTAICDELFPEFTTLFRDPNLSGALAIRRAFPTPHAIATASLEALQALRVGHRPSKAALVELQSLAATSIGTQDIVRQRGLIFEQSQLIAELLLMEAHINEMDQEIHGIIEYSREGRILTSIPGVGPIQAATLLAAIGNIDNFPTAATLKSYLGWAPKVSQSGTTLNSASIARSGVRTTKQIMYLIVGRAIQMDCEWAKLYERLVPLKCHYDERRRTYIGKKKVIGRIAGQMISLMYALLKQDQEVIQRMPPGKVPPEPMLYDPAIHRAHRAGEYRSSRPEVRPTKIIQLPRTNATPGLP